MKNISKEDYIIWDVIKNEPIEGWDIVYHYTTIMEIINTDGFKLTQTQQLVRVAELSLRNQRKLSLAIELTK
jgi:hypothetical protein